MSWCVALNCAFAMGNYDPVGNIYRCRATILFDASYDTVTFVYGNHQAGRTNSDVRGLHIQGQNMAHFLRNIKEFFPNIIVLHFPSNLISTISNDHLRPFPNLVRLSMSSNRITSLDSNLFSGLSSLRYVHFGNNDLRHVGHEFVLPSSGAVYFQTNKCISRSATTASGIVNLKFYLLVQCPPTISQVETALESRPNLITNLDFQVQSLSTKTYSLVDSHIEMETELQDHKNLIETNSDDIRDVKNKNLQLETRVAFLEAAIENILRIKMEKMN